MDSEVWKEGLVVTKTNFVALLTEAKINPLVYAALALDYDSRAMRPRQIRFHMPLQRLLRSQRTTWCWWKVARCRMRRSWQESL
jgi:hypothetical protein